MPQTIILSTKY